MERSSSVSKSCELHAPDHPPLRAEGDRRFVMRVLQITRRRYREIWEQAARPGQVGGLRLWFTSNERSSSPYTLFYFILHHTLPPFIPTRSIACIPMRSSALSIVLACTLCSAALRIPIQQKKEPNKKLGRRTFGKQFSKSVLAASSGNDDDDTDLRYVFHICACQSAILY